MRWSLKIYGWWKDICRALIVLTMQVTFVIFIKYKCEQIYFSSYSISSRIILRPFSSCSLFFKHYRMKFTKQFIDLVSLEMKPETDFEENNIQTLFWDKNLFIFIWPHFTVPYTVCFRSAMLLHSQWCWLCLSVPLSSLTPNRRLSCLEMERSLLKQ